MVDSSIPWLHNVGRLSPDDCLERYRRVDGLFFPSTAESYGLPLVEAMALGIPVVCSDLPFARWLCETKASTSIPKIPETPGAPSKPSSNGVVKAGGRIGSGPLSKLPESWDEVAGAFLRLLELP